MTSEFRAAFRTSGIVPQVSALDLAREALRATEPAPEVQGVTIEPERRDPYSGAVDSVAGLLEVPREVWADIAKDNPDVVIDIRARLHGMGARLRVSSWDPRARRLLKMVRDLIERCAP